MFRMVLRCAGVSNVFYEDTNTDETQKVLDPKLDIQENSAGKLTFTVPTTNIIYSKFGFVDEDDADNNTIDSWVDVYKENEMYWSGRIISRQVDFWKSVKVECEGLLAVLNDTIQPPYHYQNITPRSFLEGLLTIHNGRVNDPDRMIFLGNVTVGTSALGSTHRYTNYETTLTCILEKLVNNIGGRIKLRYNKNIGGGRWYLDYLADYDELNSQTIQFGRNLFEYSRSMSSADYCTVVVPRGKQLESGPYEALTAYLTVASVNNGDIHVSLTAADYGGSVPGGRLPQEIYGNIEKVVDWSDIETASKLLSTAKVWLKDKQFADMQLEIGAMDLHYAGAQYQVIELGNTVRVLSPPHGMDRVFPVTKMEIKLDTPEDTLFTLGKTSSVSMTAISKGHADAIANQFANIPTEQKLTTVFRQEATDLINHATTGYINIIQNDETGAQELVFSKTPNYHDSVGIWRWTYNGLGWKPGLYDDETNYTIAITNDGRINADFISTGTLIADIIGAGILTDQSGNNNFWFNLSTGEYRIRAIQDIIDGTEQYVTLTQLDMTAAGINASVTAVANGLAAAQAQINVQATEIDSKVSMTDYTGNQIISRVNQTATTYTINASRISLAGKTIALTSDNITISSTYFSVDKNGKITATSGTIGGFTIDASSIHTADTSGSSTSSGAVYLSKSDFSRSIGGTNRTGLRFAIGGKFAVGASGALYASDAIIKGDVTATTLKSDNAAITGGYFKVTTGSYSENAIVLTYSNYTNSMSPYGDIIKNGTTAQSTIAPDYINVRGSGVITFQAKSNGYFSLKSSNGTDIFNIADNGTVISKAITEYGNLANTSRYVSNSTSKTFASDTATNILSITLPAVSGLWLVTGGGYFGANSVGRRGIAVSRTSGSMTGVENNSVFYVPASSGGVTGGSVSFLIRTYGSSLVLYLNAFQNTGQSWTFYGKLEAVCIG